MYSQDDTIFVQIASYRDPELQHTLQDLFQKASRPKNIFVGICHQYDTKDNTDRHLFEVPFPRPEQLRIDEIDYRDSQGCCWARSRVQKLWRNEKWTLMIDSHMRFVQGWDEICVNDLKELIQSGIKKPVLSAYVCPYKLDGTAKDDLPVTTAIWHEDRVVKAKSIITYINKKKINNGIIASGHFTFASAEIINDVAHDPFLYFIGEEVSLAARLWTRNYDIIMPNKVICYHLYRDNENEIEAKYRDIHKAPNIRNENSFSRVQHLFNTKKSQNPKIIVEIEKYGLGDDRTLRDYERFSGIDFRKRKVREHTKQGVFEEWQEVSNTNIIKQIFKNA
jgi:hypothetical protein